MDEESRPIQEKFLTEGWGLGFQWKDGWTWSWVTGKWPTRIRRYTTGLNKIAPMGSQDFLELKDPNGQKIFDVLARHAPNMVLHVGIGIKPAQIRMYVKYPSGIDLRAVPNVDPVTLDGTFTGLQSFLTSKESPYRRPTDAAEFFFPWTMSATFGFVNSDRTRVHQPTLNLEMAVYKVEIMDPDDPDDLETIRRMAKGQIKTRFYTLGPAWAVADYTLEKYWDVRAMPLKELRGGH
jgi:hypothetical protein